MIDTILNLAKTLLALLPFVLLCLVGKKANLPQPERSKQFLMVAFSLVYAVVAMCLMNRINEWLLVLLDNIPKWIAALANFSWMPQKVGSFFTSAADIVESFLQNLNLNYWIFYLSNAAIIFVYIIFKKICISVLRRAIKTDGSLHARVAENFYEYFSERGVWCVKASYAQTRSLLKVFYYGAVVLSVLLMLVSRRFYFDGLLRTVFYPVFGIILIGELYFYLDGVTKQEYSNDLLGEDDEAYRVVNYSLLRKFLRSIFGDKQLAENTSVNSSLGYDVTTDDVIRELEKSEDPKVVSFASFISAFNRTGASIDHNYLYSSLRLLNGESILFNNPFYNDLIPYAFYPMNRVLLDHQKVLVVLGRHSIEDDIKAWVEKGIESVTNLPFLWNIGVLTSEAQDLDIGIVTRSDVLDIKLHQANADFLENVGFVVVVEPSKLISTAQIGLNLLVKQCRGEEEKNLVFCMCDKNCDGLVDAMSHILMTSITEVSATEKHLGTSSYMCWETDEEYLHHRIAPNISRYLGIGTELSFAAIKNQVSSTKWYGGDAFPVTDIRWIDKQYYYELTKYASLPTNQEAIDEHFLTTPNFWSAEVSQNGYLTVEDEDCNMFEALRDFSTRTTEQGFINIISSEYLLKDYMADNASIFETDAKAIPCIVADYARSNRNTILRLVLMMGTFPVCTDVIEKELSLLGISVFDLKKQLWFELHRCYSDVSRTFLRQENYRRAVSLAYEEPLRIGESEWSPELLKVKDVFNLKHGKMETTYLIDDRKFLSQCVSELRSAGYVAEDEKGQRYYLGAELSGHIYQKFLPGQFFTFGGKYYEMQYLTADGQILVRRAADHITGRPAYRQIRRYVIHGTRPSEKIGAQQDIAGMKIVREFADISVQTPGYYRMKKYNDFTTASRVSFEGGQTGIPERVYKNKEILRIELPDLGEKYSDTVRYTVTVLFNEIFRTVFAENQAYFCAVTDDSFLGDSDVCRPLTYSIEGDGCELRPNAIYLIEDSQLDLGLLVAFERNIQRIFGIMHDYLDWHTETLEASLTPPPEPLPPVSFTEEEKKPKKKRIRRFFAAIGRGIKKIFNKIKSWFKRKPKKEDPTDSETTDGTTPEGETDKTLPTDKQRRKAEKQKEKEAKKEAKKKAKEEKKEAKRKAKEEKKRQKKEKAGQRGEEPTAGEGISDGEGTSSDGAESTSDDEGTSPDGAESPSEEQETEGAVPEPEDSDAETSEDSAPEDGEGVSTGEPDTTLSPSDNELQSSSECDTDDDAGFSVERLPYHKRYYMLYGGEGDPSSIDLPGTLRYLSELGFAKNPLKQARDSKDIAAFVEATFKPGKPDALYCDFCGTEIFGVEYETLADGRDRCLNCARTAVKTEAEFRKIFEDVKRNMESFFGIRINVGIKVEMVNSRKLHKRLGQAFLPSPKMDARVLGVAIKDKNGYSLLLENGSPRMMSMLTMAHELTHIWQYLNWNDKAIRKKYGRKLRLEIYEGMAKWAEVQYAYLMNEPATAKREEIISSYRDDEYGRGFLRYRANYPFSLGTVITKRTPFMDPQTPLDPDFCGQITFVPPVPPTGGDDDGDPSDPTRRKKPKPSPIQGPIERKPGACPLYAFHLLSADEQTAYHTIFEAIRQQAPELNDLGVSLSDQQVLKIIDYVQRDHPELFWFQRGESVYYETATKIVNKIAFKYCMTPEEAKGRQAKIDASLQPFLSAVTDGMSDYEVTLRIYENIINLVDYDTLGLERETTSFVRPEVPDDLRSIYGVFVNHKAVCAGYARALQYLLNRFGIECVYVVSQTHAWNLIKLEGDYYHIDVTWGDGSNTKKEVSQSNAISYDCFCITTEQLSRLDSHTPLDTMPLPVCTATKCNYHIRHGLYFESFDFEKIRSIVCEYVNAGKFDVSFRFASPEAYREAEEQLIKNGKFGEVVQYINLKADTRIGTSYSYSPRPNNLVIAFFLKKQ